MTSVWVCCFGLSAQLSELVILLFSVSSPINNPAYHIDKTGLICDNFSLMTAMPIDKLTCLGLNDEAKLWICSKMNVFTDKKTFL